jgi:hypothetical protein
MSELSQLGRPAPELQSWSSKLRKNRILPFPQSLSSQWVNKELASELQLSLLTCLAPFNAVQGRFKPDFKKHVLLEKLSFGSIPSAVLTIFLLKGQLKEFLEHRLLFYDMEDELLKDSSS